MIIQETLLRFGLGLREKAPPSPRGLRYFLGFYDSSTWAPSAPLSMASTNLERTTNLRVPIFIVVISPDQHICQALEGLHPISRAASGTVRARLDSLASGALCAVAIVFLHVIGFRVVYHSPYLAGRQMELEMSSQFQGIDIKGVDTYDLSDVYGVTPRTMQRWFEGNPPSYVDEEIPSTTVKLQGPRSRSGPGVLGTRGANGIEALSNSSTVMSGTPYYYHVPVRIEFVKVEGNVGANIVGQGGKRPLLRVIGLVPSTVTFLATPIVRGDYYPEDYAEG